MAMGIWLKETLREKGMTIKQLSELSGVSLNTLYSITKRDTERIDPAILRQIKKAIGLDKTELEPCPFCGTEAEFCSDGSDNWGVKCKDSWCIANDIEPCFASKELAIEAWNRRTPA